MRKCRGITVRKITKPDGSKIFFRPPVKLSVTYSGGLFSAEGVDLPFDVWAYSRDQLKKNITEEITFLVEDYTDGDELMMNGMARRLRNGLLDRMAGCQGVW